MTVSIPVFCIESIPSHVFLESEISVCGPPVGHLGHPVLVLTDCSLIIVSQ